MADRFSRAGDPRARAEAAFKSLTRPPVADTPTAAVKAPVVPNAREQVTLRLDREVLEHFQAEGPGWQDRINAALRQAAGK